MKNTLFLATFIAFALALSGCGEARQQTSDQIQHRQQESILQEGSSAVGMPSITNFREKRLLKQIYEQRDKDGLVTYTYIVAENTGKFIFVCNSVGYGIPAATQYTNPSYIAARDREVGIATLPQADPNGLFSPASADGTWVMCKDPTKDKAVPTYLEPRIIVSTFKLN